MRAFGALLGIVLVVAAAVFFADVPGRVEIVWRGWQVETSPGVLVAVAVVAALVVILLFSILSLLLGTPRAILRRRRERKRRAGYRALTQGMVAVAAGEPEEALRCARRADALLADPPLTLLLSAQAAQIGGDETAAKQFFTAMLDRPETAFLGLRGLLNQALRDGDRGTARRLAERAMLLRPGTRWAAVSLFDLEARAGRWEAAGEILLRAAKHRLIAAERARHHRGVIRYELSCAALAGGDRRRAVALAAEARTLAPDLAAPAAHHARLLIEDGRIARAAKAVERAWRTAPHPQLAQIYGGIWDGDAALARVARFERLAAQNPAARESHLALAEAALGAQLWGEARRHLDRALTTDGPPFFIRSGNWSRSVQPAAAAGRNADAAGPTVRLCLMMARLEEAEHVNQGEMRKWLDRAVSATPDPRYICASCGGESPDWHSLCPHCGGFDTLAWRTPVWSGAAASLPPAAEHIARPELAAAPRPEIPLENIARD